MTTAQAVLAAGTHAPAGARVLAGGDGDLGAGFIAFLVVVGMSIACYFLFRSMTRHIKGVPASFEPAAPADPATPATPVES